MKMKRKLKMIMTVLLTVMFLIPMNMELLHAEVTQNVSYQVTFKQSEARSQLAYVNALRTGDEAYAWNSSNTDYVYYNCDELVYDYQLEKIAMQRCAEIAIYYSHTRPMGSSCFTAVSEEGYSYWALGENIAAGTGYNMGKADYVFNAWKEDSYQYSGQGHRRNMLNEGFNRIGIACCYYNGAYYWVQELAKSTQQIVTTDVNDHSTQVSTSLSSSLIGTVNKVCDNAAPISMNVGESVDLPKGLIVLFTSASWQNRVGRACSLTTDYTYSVADSGIASISNGKIKGVSAGTTSLIISAFGFNQEVSVTVEKAATPLEITKQPSDVSAASGGKVTVTVGASGDDLTYQWQYSKDNGSTWINCTSTGYNKTSFSFTMKDSLNGRLYRCVVKDGSGTTLNSGSAKITLKATASAPKINVQPANVFADNGKTVTLAVQASGTDLTYQWQYSKDGSTWTNCTSAGANSSAFGFTMKSTYVGRKYRCKITAAGTTSVVTEAAVILPQTTNATVSRATAIYLLNGRNVTLTAATTGSSYQWQYSRDRGKTWVNCTSTGSNTRSFSFTMKSSLEGRIYRCVVK